MSLERLDASLATTRFAPTASAVRSLPARLLALDLLERTIVCTLFGSFAWQMSVQFLWNGDISTLLIVLAEGLPFVFVVLRKPTERISLAPGDWLIAIVASHAPLLARPDASAIGPTLVQGAAFLIMLAGFSVQVAAKIVLGTRFGIVAANRGVCTLGPYRFVRHPMYLGYTITHVGFLLAMPNAMNAGLYALALALQIVRMDREERILMQDDAYRAFAERVRYRLLPGVY
jgi:protein-S-isoprenylcysteine O-methyltransferase Ste14